jgi:hypothetical protein
MALKYTLNYHKMETEAVKWRTEVHWESGFAFVSNYSGTENTTECRSIKLDASEEADFETIPETTKYLHVSSGCREKYSYKDFLWIP